MVQNTFWRQFWKDMTPGQYIKHFFQFLTSACSIRVTLKKKMFFNFFDFFFQKNLKFLIFFKFHLIITQRVFFRIWTLIGYFVQKLLEYFKNFRVEVDQLHFVCFPETITKENMPRHWVIWKQTKWSWSTSTLKFLKYSSNFWTK